jgi:AcrR family transcriptional regulator
LSSEGEPSEDGSALYHHYPSRDDLVAAVYEREAKAAIDRAISEVRGQLTPVEQLLAGSGAWLDEVSRPDVARIVIQDGPSSLGWERCREIEGRHSLGNMTAILEAAVRAGEIEVASVELLALLLNAILAEPAMAIVRATRPERARADAVTTLEGLLAGFRTA